MENKAKIDSAAIMDSPKVPSMPRGIIKSDTKLIKPMTRAGLGNFIWNAGNKAKVNNAITIAHSKIMFKKSNKSISATISTSPSAMIISQLIELIRVNLFFFCTIPIIYIFFAGSVNNFAKFAKKGGGGNGIGN